MRRIYTALSLQAIGAALICVGALCVEERGFALMAFLLFAAYGFALIYFGLQAVKLPSQIITQANAALNELSTSLLVKLKNWQKEESRRNRTPPPPHAH